MTLLAHPAVSDESLGTLRRLRSRQAVTLGAFAVLSVVAGVGLFFLHGPSHAFWNGVAWQFVTWGAIDAIFAGTGVSQCVRVAARPPSPQAEADEFAAAEKLLRALRFNHKLNWLWLASGVGLLAWAVAVHSPALAGHGAGVVVQGGFLFVFDWIYARRFERLLYSPST